MIHILTYDRNGFVEIVEIVELVENLEIVEISEMSEISDFLETVEIVDISESMIKTVRIMPEYYVPPRESNND